MSSERDAGQKDFSLLVRSLVGHVSGDEGVETPTPTDAGRAAIARRGGQAERA